MRTYFKELFNFLTSAFSPPSQIPFLIVPCVRAQFLRISVLKFTKLDWHFQEVGTKTFQDFVMRGSARPKVGRESYLNSYEIHNCLPPPPVDQPTEGLRCGELVKLDQKFSTVPVAFAARRLAHSQHISVPCIAANFQQFDGGQLVLPDRWLPDPSLLARHPPIY